MGFKTFFGSVNKLTNLAVGVAVLGMVVTFGTLRLTDTANRPTADVELPSLHISSAQTTVLAGQMLELSVESRGFEPTEIIWLSNNDQATLSPVTGVSTTVSIPEELKGQEIIITAQAALDSSSTIQDSITINIE